MQTTSPSRHFEVKVGHAPRRPFLAVVEERRKKKEEKCARVIDIDS